MGCVDRLPRCSHVTLHVLYVRAILICMNVVKSDIYKGSMRLFLLCLFSLTELTADVPELLRVVV